MYTDHPENMSFYNTGCKALQYTLTIMNFDTTVCCLLRYYFYIPAITKEQKFIADTADSCYNDTVGIREKYQYIQTIDISSSIESLVMAGILK